MIKKILVLSFFSYGSYKKDLKRVVEEVNKKKNYLVNGYLIPSRKDHYFSSLQIKIEHIDSSMEKIVGAFMKNINSTKVVCNFIIELGSRIEVKSKLINIIANKKEVCLKTQYGFLPIKKTFSLDRFFVMNQLISQDTVPVNLDKLDFYSYKDKEQAIYSFIFFEKNQDRKILENFTIFICNSEKLQITNVIGIIVSIGSKSIMLKVKSVN